MRAHALYAVALLAGVGACEITDPTVDVPPAPSYGPGLGTAENPVPQDGATYAARSRIQLDGSGVVPDLDAVVAPLRAFSERPAETLLAIAANADVPELDQLYAALPSSLASQLEGWIDAQLAAVKISGSTVPAYAAEVLGFAETALTRFALDSTMSFSPTRGAAHTVTGIAFELSSVNVIVPLGGLKADQIAQQVPITVAENGLITFGDHHFELAFGEHVWHGVNLASITVFGPDVRTALVETVDCGKLALAVASKCIDNQCVGHQSALQTVCERSLDLLVTDLGARIAAFDSDVVHHVAGTARLVDENGDGLANRIADGVWQSELVMGPARGTFTASAEGR